MNSQAIIESYLREHFQDDDLAVELTSVSGGDIHQCFVVSLLSKVANKENLPKQLFLKLNSIQCSDVLKTEFESLKLINQIYSGWYPQALIYKEFDNESVLLMNYHHLIPLTVPTARAAGRALAQQHNQTHHSFGWSSDNYIGLTEQQNKWRKTWVNFFKEQRLSPMLEKAKKRGLDTRSIVKTRELIDFLESVLSHNPTPSLVHGDLWSGNLAFDRDANKILFFDPAPYFGDKEVDLAMTELFGRQPDSFYQAYNEICPIEVGYQERQPVYNLYHALNHVVLFGSSYNSLVDNCLKKIVI